MVAPQVVENNITKAEYRGNVFYQNNKPANSWYNDGKNWYFFQNGLAMKNKWVGNYWLGADGKMSTNSWVDNSKYYVGNDGSWVKNAKKTGWQKEGNTWYYYNQSGSLVKNAWAGNYWLGADGKMSTNSWVDNNKYYVGNDGFWVKNAKKTGWQKEGNTWYYYNQSGSLVKNAWAGNYWLGADGKMATNSWVDNNKYYVGNDGSWVKNAKKIGWQKEGSTWYYYNQNGTPVKNTWVGNYYLGKNGAMQTNSWVYDNNYRAWYYLNQDGSYARNKWAGNYWLGADGKMATNSWVDNNRYYVGSDGAWVRDTGSGNYNPYSGFYRVTALYIPVYNANGQILSHVSQGTVLFRDNRASVNGRIPVQIAGLTGYVNASQVREVSEKTMFIPDYISDGKYVYHRYSQYSKVKVAYHHPSMKIGRAYYSADGINFGTFKLTHPFQYSNLKSKTNYTAADLNRLYQLMGAGNSMLAGKGETFKAAEKRYGVNALYLVAHSALESAWGKSNIAKSKNNFFGIAAYDSNPYESATKFDNVDSGILGAARWINQKYLHNSGYPANGAYLGNKAGGMNVNYATAPFWGESIASIMFEANELLGRKDK
nr:glucosaminidase domain-containing protein [Gemella cuniculi]